MIQIYQELSLLRHEDPLTTALLWLLVGIPSSFGVALLSERSRLQALGGRRAAPSKILLPNQFSTGTAAFFLSRLCAVVFCKTSQRIFNNAG
jgi:hypothetical protein